MAVRTEVAALRLHLKFPGSDRLRKGAAAELGQMLSAGWHETGRRTGPDHLTLRMERSSTVTNWSAVAGGGARRVSQGR